MATGLALPQALRWCVYLVRHLLWCGTKKCTVHFLSSPLTTPTHKQLWGGWAISSRCQDNPLDWLRSSGQQQFVVSDVCSVSKCHLLLLHIHSSCLGDTDMLLTTCTCITMFHKITCCCMLLNYMMLNYNYVHAVKLHAVKYTITIVWKYMVLKYMIVHVLQWCKYSTWCRTTCTCMLSKYMYIQVL